MQPGPLDTTTRWGLGLSSLLWLVGQASAHTVSGSGLLHPLTGLDHLLAMLCVGAWSAQRGGRAIYLVPGLFLLAMLLGGVLGFEHYALPLTEEGIALSVLLLGLAIALAQRLSMASACFGIALFGICHGYAHGAELPLAEDPVDFAAGFMLTTAGLHITGAFGALTLLRHELGAIGLRLLGAFSGAAGVALFAHLIG